MAPRRGAEVVVEEELQGVSLAFDEPLSWRAGRAIPTKDLLGRLDALSKELAGMDQETCNKSSLIKVAKELAAHNLMHHKDKGVRAFTACCQVDILSLSAPDAPFTATQLKDIFTLFVHHILPALSDPSHAYNDQHTYVLTSLAEVKSIVLLLDLNEPDDLLQYLFTSFFDVVSGIHKDSKGEQVSKNVEYHMNSILATIIDEAQSIPASVIDTIIAQFLRATLSFGKQQNGDVDEKQATLLAKELPPAYTMAKYLCDSCPEKMSRYIGQYFNEVILGATGTTEAANNGDSDDEDVNTGPTESDLKELNKAHRLLRELWRASPNVLQNVIPQVEQELSAENVQLRLLATETLGDIISGIGAAGPPPPLSMDPAAYPPFRLSEQVESLSSTNLLTTPRSPQSFAQTHPVVYNGFVSRKNDKSYLIRSSWVTAIGRILVTSAGGIGLSRDEEPTLIKGLAEKLNDADERVRLSAIKAVASFSFRDVIAKLGPSGGVNKPDSVLGSLADRARDAKPAVRAEGMTLIGKIWGVAAGEIISGNESVVALLEEIPTKIFIAYYANNQDTNVLMDRVMYEQLLPLTFPPSKGKSKPTNGESQNSQSNGEDFDPDRIRTQRFLALIRSLDLRSKKAFFQLQARQKPYRDALGQFVKQCESYNGGVMDESEKDIKAKMTLIINWFTSFLPDKPRATADLWKFAKLHDRRSYALIRFIIDPENDFKTVHNAIKEFSKKIDAAPGSPAGILETLIPIIYRSASLIYNRSHLPAILEFSQDETHDLYATAHEVLKEISEISPQVFKAQVKGFCKLLIEQAPTETQPNGLKAVQTLKSCAGYARKYPKEFPQDRKFLQAMISFAQYGSPPEAAKHAVTILMTCSDRKEMHAKDLLSKVTEDWTYGSDHFLTKLATMSQLSLLAPKITDEISDLVLTIMTQDVLLKNRTAPSAADLKWQDGDLDEECQAKYWALKVLVNRIRAYTNMDNIREVAAPVYKVLNLLIFNEGELSKTNQTPRQHKSYLRLTASRLMLKLCASSSTLNDLLAAKAFVNLACVAQDRMFAVRHGFISKLKKYLTHNRLGSRFFPISFIIAFEPDDSFREETKIWIKSRAKFYRDNSKTTLEAVLPRFMSMLAHHPDFGVDEIDLLETAQYLLFYISSVATEDNIGMLYKYAERVKQTRDAISPEDSDNLYVLSDLTQAVIRKWQEKKGWNMQSYPAKTGLSKDLFAALPSHDAAQEIAEKSYLPEDMEEALDGLLKTSDKRKKRKLEDDGEKPSAKKPRASSGGKLPNKANSAKKIVRQKAPVKTPKKAKSTPTPSSAAAGASERRRSGRGAGSKSYADRDDSEDDQEMLKGVSKWSYNDDKVDPGEHSEQDDNESEDEEMGETSGEVKVAEDEAGEATPEVADEDDEVQEQAEEDALEGEEEEAEPSPPPRARKAAAAKGKAKPAPRAKSKAKGTPPAKGKARRNTRGKAKSKETIEGSDMSD